MMGVSFYLPFYNEEKVLEKNALIVHDMLSKLKYDFEIVLVDDGSTDSCSEICSRLAKKTNIRCVRFGNGPSRRENLAEAMKKANNDIIVFSDIDLSADLNKLSKLISDIERGADISTGSRYMTIKPKRGLIRKIYSNSYNTFLSIMFGSKIKDHQCGFKSFRKEKLLSLIKDMGYDNSFRRGWFWDAELLIRAQKKRMNIVEFPVKWKSGQDSTFELKRELKMIPYIFELKRRLKNYK